MSLDHCPECGRRITDYDDDNGLELPRGQRWCRDHYRIHVRRMYRAFRFWEDRDIARRIIETEYGLGEPPDEYDFQLGAQAERQSERLREGWSDERP